MKKRRFLFLIVITISIITLMVTFTIKNNNKSEPIELSYTEFMTRVEKNYFDKVILKRGSTTVNATYQYPGKSETLYFMSDIPSEEAFIKYIQDKVISTGKPEIIIEEAESKKSFTSFFINILFILYWIFFISMLFKAFRKIKNIGKNINKDMPSFMSPFNTDLNYIEKAAKSDIKFSDVAGLDEEKEELQEIVDFMKNPEKYAKLGAKIPRGVLLSGAPGTGKTLLAKAVAGEADVSYLAVSGSEFVEMYVGVGASRIRGLFKEARKHAPCIIFIDEIDALGTKRENGGNSEHNQTLEQLLTELDGFADRSQIVILAATNRPSSLDPALTRPGRFDRKIYVSLPDANGRESILKIHARGKIFEDNIDFSHIAHNTPGYSGAELANLLNEAALIAARKSHEMISKDDLDDALKKITIGLQKSGKFVSEKERRLTAVHESGHAIVAHFLETQTGIKEISIVPRGSAGGYTWQHREEDRNYRSKTELQENLAVLLAGRVAERIILDDISTGASNDIEVATRIATEMVTVYGMDSEIGAISLNGMNTSEIAIFGEKTLSSAGDKIRELIKKAEAESEKILKSNLITLNKLTEELLEKETISGKQFDAIIRELNN